MVVVVAAVVVVLVADVATRCRRPGGAGIGDGRSPGTEATLSRLSAASIIEIGLLLPRDDNVAASTAGGGLLVLKRISARAVSAPSVCVCARVGVPGREVKAPRRPRYATAEESKGRVSCVRRPIRFVLTAFCPPPSASSLFFLLAPSAAYMCATDKRRIYQ